MEQVKTEGAVAAEQRLPEPISILAAPSTADEFNTIGERLIPKGCFRMEDVRFEFDSSFIKPEVAEDMPHLADLIEKHMLKQVGSPPRDIPPPLSIFGHADPVGKEDYNKKLSGRRATAVYAMLVRDVELWEELYSNPLGRDDWGTKSIQTMLA
ncbi:MAG: OmpA family protein, partial [Limisphaerales bacterium]